MADEQQVGVGVIGYGYWGPKLVRNFDNAKWTRTAAICEIDDERRSHAEQRHPTIDVFGSLPEMLADSRVEAVAVATPVKTHHALVKQALLAGKHVLVEKPFTETSEQAVELINLARERHLVLQVDHTFVFTAAVQKLRSLVNEGALGELLYYDSVRINLGLFQPDVDVIWDLAPHDFSIMDYVLPMRPKAISAVGASHTALAHSDVAHVTLDFGDNFLGHLHVNWLAPTKVRTILLGGMKKMALYDDLEQDTKIRVFDRGIELPEHSEPGTITADDVVGRYQTMINYRSGDMHAPWLARTEALLAEANAFGEAIREGSQPANDALAGLRVVLMLEATTRALERRGEMVEIDWSALDRL